MGTQPTPPFRILHLSDLHFGSFSWYKEPVETPDQQRACAIGLHGYLVEALRAVDIDGNSPKPVFDGCVISGDFTSRAEPGGFAAARLFAAEMIRSGLVRAEDLMLLPGNHDIFFGDRREDELISAAGHKRYVPAGKKDREHLYRLFFQGVKSGPVDDFQPLGVPDTSGALLVPECLGTLKMYKDRKLALLGLDSCRIESWDAPGIGYVGYDQIYWLCEPVESAWRCLAFTHHPLGVPIPWSGLETVHSSTPMGRTYDSNEIENALAEYGVDFAFYGHQHMPDIRKASNAARSAGRVAGVGSFGCRDKDCAYRHHFFIHEVHPDRVETSCVSRDLPSGTWRRFANAFESAPMPRSIEGGTRERRLYRFFLKMAEFDRRESEGLARRFLLTTYTDMTDFVEVQWAVWMYWQELYPGMMGYNPFCRFFDRLAVELMSDKEAREASFIEFRSQLENGLRFDQWLLRKLKKDLSPGS